MQPIRCSFRHTVPSAALFKVSQKLNQHPGSVAGHSTVTTHSNIPGSLTNPSVSDVERAKLRLLVQTYQLETCLSEIEQLAEGEQAVTSPAANTSSSWAEPDGQGSTKVFQALKGMHEALFSRLIATGNLDGVQRYLALLPRKPKLFSSLMKACTQQGNAEALKLVLKARCNLGMPLDEYCYCATITLAAKARDAAGIRTAFKQAAQDGVVNTVLCNAAMAGMVKAEEWQEAVAIWEYMHSVAIPADVYSYNAMLATKGALGDAEGVKQILEHLQQREGGVAPDARTYSVLFKAVAGRPKLYSYAWLMQAYRSMSAQRVQPNRHIVASFLGAAAVVECTPAEAERLLGLVQSWRAAQATDSVSYTLLLHMVGRRGLTDRLLDVWLAVQEDDVPKTPRLYSALFKAAAQAPKPVELQPLVETAATDMMLLTHSTAVGLVQRRMAERHGSDGNAGTDVRMDNATHEDQWRVLPRRQSRGDGSLLVACNALLHYYAKCCNLAAAQQLFQTMDQDMGVAPDRLTYTSLIQCYAAVGDLKGAIQVFGDMRKAGHVADSRTYVCLMMACATSGRTDTAQKLLDLMLQAQLQPTVEAYTTLMDAHIKSDTPGGVAAAFDVFERMQRSGVPPTAVTYGCLLHGCGVIQDVQRAMDLYQRACSEGVLPTDECHNTLINVCIKGNRLDEALDLVKRLARAHGHMQAPMLNSLTRALAASHPDRALRIVALMRNRRMEPTRGTYLALIKACAVGFKASVAHSLYQQLRAAGHPSNQSSGSALIISLCEAGDLVAAQDVFRDMSGCSPVAEDQGEVDSKRSEISKATPAKAAAAPQLSDTPSRPLSSPGSKELPTKSFLPTAPAIATMVHAHAQRGMLRHAAEYFELLRTEFGEDALGPLTLSHRAMWETLIETGCRRNDVPTALLVFDEWKAACTAWTKNQRALATAEHAASAALPSSFPKLSNATLAYLESCCRGTRHEWRVYDVCAEMRQAKERKHEAQLARPSKASHHFRE